MEVSENDNPKIADRCFSMNPSLRWSGRFKTGHPVTLVEDWCWCPGLVPLTGHVETVLVFSINIQELPGRAAPVGQVGHVVPGDQAVVVGRVNHQVCGPDLGRQDGVLQAVDGHSSIVLTQSVLGVGRDQGRRRIAGDV